MVLKLIPYDSSAVLPLDAAIKHIGTNFTLTYKSKHAATVLKSSSLLFTSYEPLFSSER